MQRLHTYMPANIMSQLNQELNFAQKDISELCALFGHNKSSMIYLNKVRALCDIDSIIEVMQELKQQIKQADERLHQQQLHKER